MIRGEKPARDLGDDGSSNSRGSAVPKAGTKKDGPTEAKGDGEAEGGMEPQPH
ncbi:hypothetical protein D3C86_2225470 [compost metagenome]